MTVADTSFDQQRVDRLADWFNANARDLPWRHDRTGYTGLVSEAMLQQTQVERVVPAYRAFMQRFPTIDTLARADEQDVLAMWNGLGYYRRARNLHAAARTVVDEHEGRIPIDVQRLRALPGVGQYTAGAIASIVHGRAEPIVDGNVQRVIARWDADDSPPTDRASVKRTWARAAELVQLARDPSAFNEGMMELGARVCTPRNPSCEACPVAEGCRARELGRTDSIPPAKKPPKRSIIHYATVVCERNGAVLFEQRSTRGLWASMWQTPTIESDVVLDDTAFSTSLPFLLTRCEEAGAFVHVTSHREVRFVVYRGATRRRSGQWIASDAMRQLPMSNAMRRVLEIARP